MFKTLLLTGLSSRLHFLTFFEICFETFSCDNFISCVEKKQIKHKILKFGQSFVAMEMLGHSSKLLERKWPFPQL